MSSSATDRPTIPTTLWLARGRRPGPEAESVVRQTLLRRKDDGLIDDHLEPHEARTATEHVFEARWRVAGEVTVRARLSLSRPTEQGQEWVLLAEAERPWDLEWPSPATMFWPEGPDTGWDREPARGLSLREVNRLPEEDKEIRRLLRDCVDGGWGLNLVVHEAMTPDEHGRQPLSRLLPPSLRHRVVEHRAAPEQLRVVNRALREFGVEVPRGGAVLLHGKQPGVRDDDFAVRTVFLDGSQPTELIDALARFTALPPPLPDGAGQYLTALREDWRLMTLEEELARERRLVAMYSEALEAMTRSRDLYREAADRAHEALTAYRESDAAPAAPVPQPPEPPVASPFQQLTRGLERFRTTAKSRRPKPAPETGTDEESGTADGDEKANGPDPSTD
ncbi:hypothetical protein ACIQI8_01920 [Streptomyces sp. NPDC092369]|uniref:hypothetical protein n=1 Tax=Streptomyces sp. NPDC092369 TaxID=3366015 RepID=UPI00380AF0C3